MSNLNLEKKEIKGNINLIKFRENFEENMLLILNETIISLKSKLEEDEV
jgi:hypothetical protein